MTGVRYPSLYQINTRILIGEMTRSLGRPATLDDLPDVALDRIRDLGFDWVWFLGVWATGPSGRAVSRERGGYLADLPDCAEGDICGSPFAVAEYAANPDFGDAAMLARLRQRLHNRGLKLMLDFVPNHTGLDHPWVRLCPQYYIQGTEADLAREPENYRRVETRHGPVILAYGRDPYFAGWPDTFQLNYRHPGLRDAMAGELRKAASACDGVRCDMAMLVLPDVFQRTWGERSIPVDGAAPVDEPFWPGAIGRVKAEHPGFVFLAEVYWDLEWVLQQQGFDYCYDKRFYDRLREGHAGPLRDHLRAGLDYQDHLCRFLENHDEPRAAAAFPPEVHRAAAIATFFTPGLRFFHEGQLVGRRAKVSMHLGRRPVEPVDDDLAAFYDRLLAVLRRDEPRRGIWRLLEIRAAWDGNPTGDQFLAYLWEVAPDGPDTAPRRLLVAINYGPTQGQCYVTLPLADLTGRTVGLRDLLGPDQFDRDGSDLAARGLYLDMRAWGYHAFQMDGN